MARFMRNPLLRFLHTVALCGYLWSIAVAQNTSGLECWMCPDLQSTFIRHVESYYNYSCYEERVTLTATILCREGFRQTHETYESLCTCNEDLCEWEDSGKCEIEILGVVLAFIAMIIILCLFFLIVCCVLQSRRCRWRWKKALYDTSRDGSIIDGHREKDDHVVALGMAEMPPGPRVIPIEDEDEKKSKVLPSAHAEVHFENSCLQAGTSTELLIDGEAHGDEDGSARYANVGTSDRPLSAPPTGNGVALTAPSPSVPADSESATAVTSTAEDEPLYAKINKSKPARDPSRPRGRRAGIDDLLSGIDANGPPLPTASVPKDAVENMSAEVDADMGRQAAPPPPVAAKPARQSSKLPRGAKRYIPPSQLRTSSKKPAPVAVATTSGALEPPSPPMDDVNKLYAQINFHRETLKEHAAWHGERESPSSADEGFEEQSVAKL